MKILCINFEPDLTYLTKRGLNIEATCVKINLPKFPSYQVAEKQDQSGKVVKLYSPWVEPFLNVKYKSYEYSAILVGFDPKLYGTEYANSGGYTHWKPLNCGSFWATVRLDGNEKLYALHELQHVLGNIINTVFKDYTPKDYMDSTPVNGVMIPYYKNDNPEAPDGNYAYTWNLYKKFLPQLNAISYTSSKPYKYFSQKEVDTYKLKPELWSILDSIRESCGFPIVLTSGLRTKEENDKLPNSVEDSAHISGLAVDLQCNESIKRFKIVEVALKNGIKRIGIGKTFIHLDIDQSKPQEVVWLYN